MRCTIQLPVKNNKPIHNRLLEMTITFIPNRAMDFKNLSLVIDDVKFKPTENAKLKLVSMRLSANPEATVIDATDGINGKATFNC